MKRAILFLAFSLFVVSSVFAQTTVEVFKNNRIQFGGETGNVDPVINLDGNREIARKFYKGDGQIPESVFDAPVRIKAHITLKPVMVDDTTMADPYLRTGWVYISAIGSDDKFELGRFITTFGGKLDYDLDITSATGLIKNDFQIYLKVDTWANPAQEASMEFVFTPDNDVVTPFWIGNVVGGAGGQSHELTDGRFENDINIPADVQDFGISYTATGHGGDQTNEITNTIYVDGTAIYSFEPWRDDCEDYLVNNPLITSDDDKEWFSTPRSGWCYGAPVFPTIISNDALQNQLNAGNHNIRFEPNMTPSNDSVQTWWSVSGFVYGGKNESAGGATKIDVTGPGAKDFLSQETEIAVRIDLVNNNDYLIHGASANVQVGAEDGILFSSDKDTWSNPLTVDMKSASSQIWMKATKASIYNVTFTDAAGALASPAAMEVRINENFARYATATATDSCGDNEAPRFAIDGNFGTKWCSNHQKPPYDIKIALDQARDLNYFVIYHAGNNEETKFNTGDFDVMVHNTATGQWETFAEVRDNFDDERGNITYHYNATAVNADSVIMHLITPQADGGTVARVYEIEFYKTDSPVSVEDGHNPGIPEAYNVAQNYPNPFNPSTTIEFFTPNRASVDVKVFNILGESISTLLSGEVNRGTHRLNWNGTNSQGMKVAGGIYFYSVKFKDEFGNKALITKKMILLP